MGFVFPSSRGLEVVLDVATSPALVRNGPIVGCAVSGLRLALGDSRVLSLPFIPSKVLLREFHSETSYANVARLAFVGAMAAGAAYLAFRGFSLSRQALPTSSTLTHHLSQESEMDEELSGDVGEAESIIQTITFGTMDPVALVVPVPTPRRGRKHPFLTHVILSCKNSFYGLPSATVSNTLAVSKKVEEMCREKGCTDTDTRKIMAIAVPAVFSPDKWDVSAALAYNTDIRCQNRADLKRAATIKGWCGNLLAHPLKAKSWRRAFDVLCGLPDWEAHRVIK